MTLLAGAAVVLALSGCAEMKSAYEAVAGPSHSEKLEIDGEVETPTGKYASIRVSDDYINSVLDAAGSGSVDIPNRDDPTMPLSTYHPIRERATITRYFFNDWLDSAALEGGAEDFNAWKAAALAEGKLSSSPTTLSWLNGELGGQDQWGVLGEGNLFGSARESTLIHDGKPRIADADISFGDASWSQRDEGYYTVLDTEWWVNYRVSEEVAREISRSQANTTDEQWEAFLEEEPKHGDGETFVRVEGTAAWWLEQGHEGHGNVPIYFIEYTANPSIVR
ncbi:hypothetical protein QNO03_13285 [Arthrobacter sp. zg-Y877]|nr:hypothetical protein [Arthrobacter sp. zg-Y877]